MTATRSAFLLLLSLIPAVTCAQVTSLGFEPIDAKYSTALDRIIFVSANPNTIHIYNPATQVDQPVTLSEAPLNVSLSPDGTHAAVAFVDAVAYINLSTASVAQTFTGVAVGSGQAVLGNGYIYVIPTYSGNLFSIDVATGAVSPYQSEYASPGALFDPLNGGVYTTQDLTSPEFLYHYNASAGPIPTIGLPTSTSGRTGADYVCGPLLASPDGATIYTGCGPVYLASTNAATDMTYLGSFAGLKSANGYATIRAMALSDSLQQIAAIPQTVTARTITEPLADTVVDLFSTSLNMTGQFATTPFVVNGTAYPAHGRWVFYNSSSSSMYVITQADSTANLTLDYALETINLGAPNSCAATFVSNTGSATAPGGYGTAQISAGEHCVFTATSNAAWIALASGYQGSGSTTLKFLVRPNLSSSPRSGTISLGSQTLTITQAGASGVASNPTPLSFQPIAADYDKALDKVVMASASPNEVHVYDPVSQNDQVVPLAYPPLSISVSPDGLHAAVGHDGHVSYVDLQAFTIVDTFSVPLAAQAIVLAGNGYAYPFSDSQNSYSLRLSDGTLTTFVGFGAVAHLHSSGTAIYAGELGSTSQAYRLDISSNPAIPNIVDNGVAYGNNFWLSEDGARLITSSGYANFTSSSTSQDFTADGNLSATDTVAWAAESQIQHLTAVLQGDSIDPYVSVGTQLQLYADNGLQLQRQIAMPSFSNNGSSYLSHGRYVFWNAAETQLFAFTQADSTSGLLSDFAEYTVASLQAVPACSYAVSPTTLNLGPGTGASGSINVTTNCNWSPTSNASFVSLFVEPSPYTGSGQVTVSALGNTGAARSTNATIGTQSVTINQAASTCTYNLSTYSQTFGPAGGSGSFSFTTDPTCPWTVQSSASYVTINSAQSGTGSATVQFSVGANNTSAGYLYAYLTVAGTAGFTIAQQQTSSLPLYFVPVTPCRIADTRNAPGPFGAPYVAAGTTRTLNLPSSACGIPSSASAYSLNVTGRAAPWSQLPHGLAHRCRSTQRVTAQFRRPREGGRLHRARGYQRLGQFLRNRRY